MLPDRSHRDPSDSQLWKPNVVGNTSFVDSTLHQENNDLRSIIWVLHKCNKRNSASSVLGLTIAVHTVCSAAATFLTPLKGQARIQRHQ